MATYDFYTWCLMTALVSFLGFTVENIWIAFRFKFIDNRNMHLPFLLGYGLAIALIYLTLGTPTSLSPAFRFLYYAMLFFIVSFGEIVLGTSVEKLCGFYYWDYSSLPLHFTRYTSVFTSLGFSLIIFTFMDKFFTGIMTLLSSVCAGNVLVKDVACILAALMVFDFLVSFHKMYKVRGLNRRWAFKLEDGRISREIYR